jgi:polyisoprenoid-binding protein YceI
MQVGTQRGLATLRYVFDKTASRFTVQAFATGLLSAFGHNPTIAARDFDGEVNFIPQTYEKAFVHFALKTATLEPIDDMKRDDREKLETMMFGEVLEVERFPVVVFESKQIAVKKLSDRLLQASVAGDLTLRGVTRAHDFDARVLDMSSTLRISGSFALNQSDYGIKPVSFAGGALRLKNELKFSFEIVARLDEQPRIQPAEHHEHQEI